MTDRDYISCAILLSAFGGFIAVCIVGYFSKDNEEFVDVDEFFDEKD